MFKCSTLSISSKNIPVYHKISNGVIFFYLFFWFVVMPDRPVSFLEKPIKHTDISAFPSISEPENICRLGIYCFNTD